MPHTTYNGYTIYTQVAMPDDNTVAWRYRLHKRSPLTDWPSEFIYDTAQAAEDAARRHVDSLTTPQPAIADLMAKIEADTQELAKAVQALDETTVTNAFEQVALNAFRRLGNVLSQPNPNYPKED